MIYYYTYTVHDMVVLRRIYEIEIILILVNINTQIYEEPQRVRIICQVSSWHHRRKAEGRFFPAPGI